MKSIWKLQPVQRPFFRSKFNTRLLNAGLDFKLWVKGTRIFSDLLEKNFQVYSGGKFVALSIKKEMLGSFIGSFVLTKRITAVIHSKTHKNKKGRRKKKK